LELLRELGRELGFTAHGLPAVELDGVTISSTRIRDAIRAGNLESASRLLGRPYSLEGAVVAGDQIGRQMGFPTANLDVPGLLLPPNGVYAVQARTGGRAYPAVLNIGLRPTLKSPTPQLRVEAHLIHTQLDLYGARLELVFKARLRSEMPFHSLAELQAQIARDIASAQAIL
jgi:riboflavin kinase/FMN adenylyltransferase